MASWSGLPRTVIALSAVSLLNDLASEMVYPLLPAFLSLSLGAGPILVAMLDRLPDVVTSAIRWWSGRQADRPGWRRPLVAVGYTLAIGLRPLMGLSGAP